MGKICVGVMVLATLFTLGMCKPGWAFETSPIPQQETTVGGGTIGEPEARMVEVGLVGDQTPSLHPDRTKEKKAVATGNSGIMPIIPNSAYGAYQYPTAELAPSLEH